MLSKTESLVLLAHRVWSSYPGTRTRLFEDGPIFTGRFHGMSPTLRYPFSFSSIFASHCQIGWSYDSNSQCFNFHFCLPGETLILFDLFGWFESSWFFFPVNAPPISIPCPMGYHRNMGWVKSPFITKIWGKTSSHQPWLRAPSGSRRGESITGGATGGAMVGGMVVPVFEARPGLSGSGDVPNA